MSIVVAIAQRHRDGTLKALGDHELVTVPTTGDVIVMPSANRYEIERWKVLFVEHRPPLAVASKPATITVVVELDFR